MNIKNATAALIAITMSASLAIAQTPQGPPPGGPGGGPGGHQGGPGGSSRHGGPPPHLQQGEGGEGGGHRRPPHHEESSSESAGGGGNFILAALDANQDFELSRTEIKNAVRVLKSLDTNGDGKITMADNGGSSAREGRGRGGPGGGPGGRGERGSSGRGGPGGHDHGGESSAGGEADHASGFADRLLAFDKDGDGNIAKSELPSRMQRVVDNIDLNGDEVIDASELEQLRSASDSAATSDAGHGGGHGPSSRGGGPGGPPGGGQGGPGGHGGPGAERGPEQMIKHAFEFDKDGDGKLSREELTAFAETMGQHRGGQGGPPPRN